MADSLIPLDAGGDIPSTPAAPQASQAAPAKGDALIPLAPTPSANPVATAQSADVPVTPYNFTVGDVSTTAPLKQAWAAAGHDPSQVPDDTWQEIQNQYRAARNPQGAGDWIQNQKTADVVGSGMQDTLNGTLGAMGIKIPEPIQAKQFFGQNIQTREIEKGANIDESGNYVPPTARTVGQVGMAGIETYLGAKALGPPAGVGGAAVARATAPAMRAAAEFAAEHPYLAKAASSVGKGIAEASGVGLIYKAFSHND